MHADLSDIGCNPPINRTVVICHLPQERGRNAKFNGRQVKGILLEVPCIWEHGRVRNAHKRPFYHLFLRIYGRGLSLFSVLRRHLGHPPEMRGPYETLALPVISGGLGPPPVMAHTKTMFTSGFQACLHCFSTQPMCAIAGGEPGPCFHTANHSGIWNSVRQATKCQRKIRHASRQ